METYKSLKNLGGASSEIFDKTIAEIDLIVDDKTLINRLWAVSKFFKDITVSGGIDATWGGGTINFQAHELLRAPTVADKIADFSVTPFLTLGWQNNNVINVCDKVSDITVTLELHPDFTNRAYQETFVQKGAGNVVFVGGAGVTVITSGTTPKTLDVGASAQAIWLSASLVLIVGRLD